MSNSLLATKLYAPPLSADFIARPSLVKRIEDGFRSTSYLTLISAPLGYGKTTLITEWLMGEAHPFTWLTLDKADNDPLRFFRYLRAALQKIDPVYGRTVQPLLERHTPPPTDTLITGFINDIVTSSPLPFVLVLDDYHTIQREEIHTAIQFLLDHHPPQLHLTIITREDPPLLLTRAHAQGRVTELRANELSFTLDETAAFFDQTIGVSLETNVLEALAARTEGWIAGLKLAAISLKGRDETRIAEFVEAFSGSHHYVIDYLAEEVLRRQPDHICDFLYQTALLDRFSASLCDAVLDRTDSNAILAHLEEANLFLIPLDERHEWYRYHHLFADCLRAMSRAYDRTAIHRNAAQWYDANGLVMDTVKHVVAAGDMEDAGRLIERVAEDMLKNAEHSTLLQWLDALPDELVRSNYALATFKSWALLLSGQTDEAESYAADATAALPTDATPLSRGRLLAVRAWLASAREHDSEAIRLSQHALELIDDSAPLFQSATLSTLAQTQERSGNTTAAIQTYRDASHAGQKFGYHLAALVALNDLVALLTAHGRRREAETLCRQAADQLVDSRGTPLPLAILLYVPAGTLAYQANDLQTAREYLHAGVAYAEQLAVDSVTIGGMWALARLQNALDEWHAALGTLQAARRLVTHAPPLAATTAALTAELKMKRGDVEAGVQWAERIDPSQDTLAHPHREAEYLTYARVLLNTDRVREAGVFLGTLEQAVTAGQRYGTAITVHILQALTALRLGERSDALQHLEQALHIAAPENYCRVFLDESRQIATLLPGTRHVAPAFVDMLMEQFSLEPDERPSVPYDDAHQDALAREQRIAEPLTERELDVLRLLAAGFSNREIAQHLVITVGTAKWYISNIYSKLDVHNRTEAVVRGQDLHIL